MNIHIMNNISDLDISLLGFLSEKPMHGYELHHNVTDLKGFGIVWHLKIGKLYAMLNKLHDAALVSVENYQKGNRPVRNEYRITKAGEIILNQWLEKPVLHGRDFRHYFMLKLFFSLNRGEQDAVKLIHAQKKKCTAWKEQFESKRLDNGNLKRNPLNYQDLVNQYRLTQVEADLEWLQWSEENIGEEK